MAKASSGVIGCFGCALAVVCITTTLAGLIKTFGVGGALGGVFGAAEEGAGLAKWRWQWWRRATNCMPIAPEATLLEGQAGFQRLHPAKVFWFHNIKLHTSTKHVAT